MYFDLTDLRLFVLVTEAGSITGGAVRAGLALASASARVRGMEQQAGTALLQRQRRGVRPTAAGEVMLRHARLVLQQMDQLRGALGGYAKGLQGQVRLLANTAASDRLAGPVAAFLAANPGVDIDMEERTSRAVTEAVASGQAEIGIAAGHADFSGLERYLFARDRLVLAVPPGHALAARPAVMFAAVLDQAFVGLMAESALQQHLAALAVREGGRLLVRGRAPGLDGLCRMVALGAGLAVVPEAAAGPWQARGELGLVRLDDPWAERLLFLAVRRLDVLPVQASRLAAHLLGQG